MHGLLILFVVLAVVKQCVSTWADGVPYRRDLRPEKSGWEKLTRKQQFAMCVFLGFLAPFVVWVYVDAWIIR